jgi:hypothetical protein
LQAIIKAFWQIILFRSGPQTLPDSQLLLMFSGLIYVLSNVLFIFAQYPVYSLPAVIVDLILISVWCCSLLAFFGMAGRIRQTLTAMFGAGALLQFITLPIIVTSGNGTPGAFTMLALVIILLWSTAVHGYILSRALDKSFGIGIALAVVYFFISNGILGPLLVPAA